MKGTSSKEFFIDELKDLYSAENELIKNLPKLEKPTTDPDLIEVFEMHLKLIQKHISQLERAVLFKVTTDAASVEALRFQMTREVAALKTSVTGLDSLR